MRQILIITLFVSLIFLIYLIAFDVFTYFSLREKDSIINSLYFKGTIIGLNHQYMPIPGTLINCDGLTCLTNIKTPYTVTPLARSTNYFPDPDLEVKLVNLLSPLNGKPMSWSH